MAIKRRGVDQGAAALDRRRRGGNRRAVIENFIEVTERRGAETELGDGNAAFAQQSRPDGACGRIRRLFKRHCFASSRGYQHWTKDVYVSDIQLTC
jgi:hypothetical protein